MIPHHAKPSNTRGISPRELDFMLGRPIGDFHPEPFYIDGKLSPIECTGKRGCQCSWCRPRTLGDELIYCPEYEGDPNDAALPFVPDPSHSTNYGTVRKEDTDDAPEN